MRIYKGMRDIIPYHFEGLNCYEDAVVSVIARYRTDYKLLFFMFWGFVYEKNNVMGDGIKRNSVIFSRIIKDVFSIDLNMKWEMLDENKLEEIPVIIFMDTYWCSWHMDFKKSHHIHYVVINEVHEEGVICIDAAFEKEGTFISWEELKKGHTDNSYFSHDDYIPVTEFSGLDNEYSIPRDVLWNEMLNIFSMYDLDKAFKQLIYDFKTVFIFDKEYEMFERNVTDVAMDRKLGMMCGCRKLFVLYLKELTQSVYVENLEPVIEKLEHSAKLWNSIKIILRKCYFSRYTEKSLKNIIEIIQEISSIELEIFYLINVSKIIFDKC